MKVRREGPIKGCDSGWDVRREIGIMPEAIKGGRQGTRGGGLHFWGKETDSIGDRRAGGIKGRRENEKGCEPGEV